MVKIILVITVDIAPKIPYIYEAMFSREIYPTLTKSYFLFGPRQTGKSTFVKSLLGPGDLYIDLLPQRNFLNYAKTPGRIREEILAHLEKHPDAICVIDEIQKIPSLLDEVHELIESLGLRFILTGSSARKLRRGAANLLAGRAYTYRLFPLSFSEIGKAFALDRALSIGTLPVLWGFQNENQILPAPIFQFATRCSGREAWNNAAKQRRGFFVYAELALLCGYKIFD